MHEPPLDEMMDRVDSRYTLVVIAAKRARQLTEIEQQAEQVEETKVTNKPVTAALFEVVEGKVNYKRIKEGIK